MTLKRYAICGLSNRAVHEYALPLIGSPDADDDYSAFGRLVGIVDVDRVRCERFLSRTSTEIPLYAPDDFARMVQEQQPDVVIVAGPDFTHSDYAVMALQLDLDVIVEKPLAHSAAAARRILDAERDSLGTVTVAHNARYEPAMMRLRELVSSGTIGRVVAIDVVEGLDSYHGASYFMRWHRRRENSGGLTVTKGSHTIDAMSWLIDDFPRQVYSAAALNFFGPRSPHRPYSLDHTPFSPSVERQHDPYVRRWANGRVPVDQELFTGPWQELGYAAQYPDAGQRSIFDEEIDVEDTYSAVLTFSRGCSMTYSLCFSLPWEGIRVGITGTSGRIETEWIVFRDDPNPPEHQMIRVNRLFGSSEEIIVSGDPRGHDLADSRIRRDLFRGPSDESRRAQIQASVLEGALVVATGEAMWRSAVEGRPVDVAGLMGLETLPERPSANRQHTHEGGQ